MEVLEKFRGSKYGAVDLGLLLPRPLVGKTRTWLLSVYAVPHRSKRPRQYSQPLPPPRMTLVVSEEMLLLCQNCLKNRGRVGRQPTIIPIDISAKLRRVRYHIYITERILFVPPKSSDVDKNQVIRAAIRNMHHGDAVPDTYDTTDTSHETQTEAPINPDSFFGGHLQAPYNW